MSDSIDLIAMTRHNWDIVISCVLVIALIFSTKSTVIRWLFLFLGFLLILRIIAISYYFFIVADIIGGIILLGMMASVLSLSKEIKNYFYRLVGQSKKGPKKLFNALVNSNDLFEQVENTVLLGLDRLKKQGEGALIIIEGEDNCLSLGSSGTLVQAELSMELIQTIFQKTTALHDGAVLVKDNQIHTAGLILPLSHSNQYTDWGTRHRAAAGLTELCDARVYVLSEERGIISIFEKGKIISTI